MPTKRVRLRTQEFADYDLQPVSEHLTRDNYILLFDKCSDLLHAANPYSESQPPYMEFMSEAPEWLRKTMALLNHHHICPLDTDMMFIVQMGRAGQDVSLTPFVEARSSALSRRRSIVFPPGTREAQPRFALSLWGREIRLVPRPMGHSQKVLNHNGECSAL